MQKRRYFVPKSETVRYYGRVGLPDPSNVFFDCDFKEDENES